ncbi:hypothetical protein [Aquabacterium sp. CECT 9606]|uniref:hypothetical protein n=1 Tax=Aquabacterium sp. CECT 9606 TaxID=2845822 RepID=UPI001E566633|nr:hypothetical protein [Aquabacterium sp. CECT 9606]CAH0356048.1 hypothetical protein AQB9606_04519 [Aquabacterium sp. CECT 9606]
MSKDDSSFLFSEVSDNSERSRADLVESWFGYRAAACRNAADRAKTIAFSGIDGNESTTPAELVQKIEALRLQINFNSLLASRSFERVSPNWTGLSAEKLTIVVQSKLKDMADSVNQVAELLTFLTKVKEQCGGITVNPQNG